MCFLLSTETYSQGINWQINGNNNIGEHHFLGTTNQNDLIIKTNNQKRLSIGHNGYTIFEDTVRVKGPFFMGNNTLAFHNDINVQGFGTIDRISSNNSAISFMKTLESGGFPPIITYESNIKIGIGTQSPQYSLHLHSGSGLVMPSPLYTIYTNTNTGQSTNDGFITGIKTNGTAVINQQEDKNIEFNTGDGVNNDTRMIIMGESTNRGNVGIGTTIPNEKLDVYGNIRLSGGNRSIGTWTLHHLYFRTNGTIWMTLNSSGNVGIGTASPSQKLDVNGNIRLRGNSSVGTFSANHLYLTTNSQTRMTITSSGDIGIGEINPLAKLHVSGNIISKDITDFAHGSFVGANIPLSLSDNNSNSYQNIVSIRNTNVTSSTDLRRIGIAFNLSNESNSGESEKMGALTLESENTWANHPSLIFWTKNEKRLSVLHNGYVGIGTVEPSNKLHINHGANTGGDANNYEAYAAFVSNNGGTGGGLRIKSGSNSASGFPLLVQNNNDDNILVVNSRGNVGIGITPDITNFKLDVCGAVRAKEMHVNLQGCDFVFEPDYDLMRLADLELFIKQNKHLPEISPALDMETEQGYPVGKLSSQLLQKIEELTLYILELNNRIQKLENENSKLKNN